MPDPNEIPDENLAEELEDFDRWMDNEAENQFLNDDTYSARND